MIETIREVDVDVFMRDVESKDPGFELVEYGDIFHELITRKKRRDAGEDVQLCPSRWPVMANNFGGLGSEDLLVLTGETGRGKSTFMLNYMVDLLHQGKIGFIASLEGGFGAFCKRVGEIILGKHECAWRAGDLGAFNEITKSFGKLYVYRPGGVTDQEKLFKAMKYAVIKHGVQFCIVDHLGFIKLEYGVSMNDATAIGNFLKKVKGFNDRYRTPVLMVAHPSKSGDKGYKEREVGMDELKGSSDIKQLADTVISLFPREQETWIRFQKIRSSDYAKHTGCIMRFKYDHMKSLLEEVSSRPERVS